MTRDREKNECKKGVEDSGAIKLQRSRGSMVEGGPVPRGSPSASYERRVTPPHRSPSLPSLLEDGILDSLLLTAPKPPMRGIYAHAHMLMHTHTHTEEGSPEAEQSRAEHLDLPLVTHSGIRGTDGKRDGERECTLG